MADHVATVGVIHDASGRGDAGAILEHLADDTVPVRHAGNIVGGGEVSMTTEVQPSVVARCDSPRPRRGRRLSPGPTAASIRALGGDSVGVEDQQRTHLGVEECLDALCGHVLRIDEAVEPDTVDEGDEDVGRVTGVDLGRLGMPI